HVEGYTATDIISRYYRMNGKNVLHPMGWDAFGLPAENFAIKTKIHPAITTQNAIKTFTSQINLIGLSYDWSKELNTSSPEYYKWTQWFFLLLYKAGLAYKGKGKVNWCDSCHTVLANEQAEGGICDRCKNEVVQKDLSQWFFKITDFIEDKGNTAGLINGLEKITWPESTKLAQINWIGKSNGTQFKLPIENSQKFLEVYTTRVDTVFGMTYVVVAPEHSLIQELKDQITNFAEVENYLIEAKKKTDLDRMEAKEKTGVELKGVKVINPFNNEVLPLFVSDYVLGHYGTGAVMAVPAHDERDFEFAKKNNLPIIQSIESKESFVVTIKSSLSKEFYQEVQKFAKVVEGSNTWEGLMLIYSEEVDKVFDLAQKYFINGPWYIHSEGLIKKILFHSEDGNNKKFNWSNKNEFEEAYNFGLSIGIKKEQLDFNKPYSAFTDDGILVNSEEFNGLTSEEARKKMTQWLEKKGIGFEKTNYKIRDWLVSRQRLWGAPIPIIYCDKCGEVPVPEKDLPVLLPDDVDFLPTGESPLSKSKIFHDVKCPICGAKSRRESDTMDTFVCSSWYFFRFADPKNNEEFASKEKLKKWLPVDIYVGGAEHSVLHLLYARFFTKVLHNLGYIDFDEPFIKLCHPGTILGEDGRKMSKSYGNVINPNDVIKDFGADALRLFEMFMGPFDEMKPWNTKGIVGVFRFLEKVWKVQEKVSGNVSDNIKFVNLMHKTIKKIGQDLNNVKFNTAISCFMILVNEMEKLENISKENFELFLRIFAPFAPHITEEIWQNLGNKKSIHLESWPVYDEKLTIDEQSKIVIQINGKLRDEIEVETNVSEEEIKNLALNSEAVKKWIEGKEIKKVIYVKGKLVSIVAI
ncbi:leucine--tRNA ligase, partial [Candidatus Gracilibacteria bacterium]|nr:leucine--tRNA ligase [Candidatus Gracilibacteria bacterium]